MAAAAAHLVIFWPTFHISPLSNVQITDRQKLFVWSASLNSYSFIRTMVGQPKLRCNTHHAIVFQGCQLHFVSYYVKGCLRYPHRDTCAFLVVHLPDRLIGCKKNRIAPSIELTILTNKLLPLLLLLLLLHATIPIALPETCIFTALTGLPRMRHFFLFGHSLGSVQRKWIAINDLRL